VFCNLYFTHNSRITLLNSRKHCCCRETVGCLADDVNRLLRNTKIHYRVHKRPSSGLILCQSSVHILKPYFLSNSFHITLSPTLGFPIRDIWILMSSTICITTLTSTPGLNRQQTDDLNQRNNAMTCHNAVAKKNPSFYI
jgi:hypothetical protein